MIAMQSSVAQRSVGATMIRSSSRYVTSPVFSTKPALNASPRTLRGARRPRASLRSTRAAAFTSNAVTAPSLCSMTRVDFLAVVGAPTADRDDPAHAVAARSFGH